MTQGRTQFSLSRLLLLAAVVAGGILVLNFEFIRGGWFISSILVLLFVLPASSDRLAAIVGTGLGFAAALAVLTGWLASVATTPAAPLPGQWQERFDSAPFAIKYSAPLGVLVGIGLGIASNRIVRFVGFKPASVRNGSDSVRDSPAT